jgi:protein gp37
MTTPFGTDAWWDYTWNPVGGCKPVSPGCTNCYAAQLAGTYTHKAWIHQGVTIRVGTKRIFNGKHTSVPAGHHSWTEPLCWQGVEHPVLGDGKPSLIFVVDMGDLFYEKRPSEIIRRVCATIALSAHIGLLLTKRTERMADYVATLDHRTVRRWQPKLWLGLSAERQQEFDTRWANMRRLADAGWNIFVSIAPMMEPVTLPSDFLTLRDRGWVIVAGEQGPHQECRDMHPNWARAIRDQCAASGIPFFMKQMARKEPIPPDLLIRQFPGNGTHGSVDLRKGMRSAP